MKDIDGPLRTDGHAAKVEPTQRMQANGVPPATDDASTEEFISRVSHDLRTPLAAIKAAIGVVLANEPPNTAESLRRMFRNIDRATDQMNSMIANLAETARLKSGSDALHCDVIDLVEVTRRVGRTTETAARRQNQVVELQVPAAPCLAMADASRIERALLNLLENAQKYGPAGGTIRINLQARGGEAIFSVSDNGPGVPDGAADRILRGEPALEGGSGKAGLGLPIARRIAELHGGRLWIDADDGVASVFRLAIPTHGVEPDLSRAQSRSEDGNG
jgi:two-component system, OmpR family, sensor histidine kinase KdpD